MRILIVHSDGDLRSGQPVDNAGRTSCAPAVEEALRSLGHATSMMPTTDRLYETLKKRKPWTDLIFNLADEGYAFKPALEPHLPAMFDVLGLPYTGANYLTLGLCADKGLSDKLLAAAGVATPFSTIVFPNDLLLPSFPASRFPLIVKPLCQDGSIGIHKESVVHTPDGLESRIRYVHESFAEPAFVQQYIDGRECAVGILGRAPRLEPLPISEILFSLPEGEPEIVSYEAKWAEGSAEYCGTTPRCPAALDPGLENLLLLRAMKAYDVLGLRDYGRVDFRIKDGIPYVIDVNPNPDLAPDAGLARMAEAKGISYEGLIDAIVRSATERP